MKTLNVALVGCGGMGSALARQLHLLENTRIVGLYDTNRPAAHQLADELSARVCASYSSLLASDVDAVVIATPNYLHAPMTIKAARAGKHVFCETPMALKTSDCAKMIRAAEEAGVKLTVGHVLRLISVYWKSLQIINSGELGKPFAVTVRRVGHPGNYRDEWRESRRQAGGILYEVNVHEFDFMRCILGEPETVFARTGHFTRAVVEYEDVAMVQMSFKNGGMAQLLAGTSASLTVRGISVQCENGTLITDGSSINYSLFGGLVTTIEAHHVQKENPFLEELRFWTEAILNDAPMPITAADGMAAVQMAEGAYKSAASHKLVKLRPER